MKLPTGWREARLDEVCGVILGQSPPGRSVSDDPNGMPFFQGKTEFGERLPTVRKWTTSPKKVALDGDVLVSVRAPVGPTNLAPTECCIGRGLAALRPGPDVSTSFLFWAMRSTESELARKATGTTFPAVSGAVLRSHTIPVAPSEEQQQVVDAIESQLERIRAATEQVTFAWHRAQALQRSLTSRWIQARESVALGDISEIISGPAFKSGNFTENPEDIRLLRGANVAPGRIDWANLSRWPREDAAGLDRLQIDSGDIVLAMDRPVISTGLKIARVRDSDLPGLLVQRVARIRCDAEFDPSFVFKALAQPKFAEYLLAGQTGTQVPHVTLEAIRQFKIPVPDLETQREIASELEAFDSVLNSATRSMSVTKKKSAQLLHATLQRAFTGQIGRPQLDSTK